MKTQENVLSLTKRLTYGMKHKEENYRGFKLISNVMHCGMGGNHWLTTVVDHQGQVLQSFSNDAYCESAMEAMKFIGDLK